MLYDENGALRDRSLFGEGPYKSLNKKIELRDVNNYKGLFAKEKILKGEIVWDAVDLNNSEYIRKKKLQELSIDDYNHFYQIGEDLFVIPKNHGDNGKLYDYDLYTNVIFFT